MTSRVYSAICSYSGILPPVNRTRLKHDCKKGYNAELPGKLGIDRVALCPASCQAREDSWTIYQHLPLSRAADGIQTPVRLIVNSLRAWACINSV